MSEMAALAFDINVAISGYITETKAMQNAGKKKGRIGSRSDALGALDRASAQVYEMEEERKKRSG